MCQPKLMTAHGHPCLVLTTEFTSQDVSLDQLKDVIDPLNWGKCLSSFFCKMEGKENRKDGWSRVLEHVSTTCWNPQTHLQTPLKYWKSQGQDEQSQQPTACINYALDDDPCPDAKGDGVFVVDEGFIRMTSTSTRQDSADPGVLHAHQESRRRPQSEPDPVGDVRVLGGIRRPRSGHARRRGEEARARPKRGLDELDGVGAAVGGRFNAGLITGGASETARETPLRLVSRRSSPRLAQIPVAARWSWPSRCSTSASTTWP